METKTIYEKEFLKDIQDLPEPTQEKLAKIIHLLKKEFVRPELKEKSATDEFLSVCGTWEDDRSIEEQIKVIYSSRKSSTKMEKVF
jgi:mRNA-degrading endonuclease YafQ of YafQ-DinJ toxin-antitoxin module